MINNGKTLNRLWGALVSDFELLMGHFMDIPGWRFEHFAKIAGDMKISLIMNMAIGRGKAKDEHYECITSLIFQSTKTFWLRARDTEFGDEALDKKRRLGGFYLSYVMYFKQPFKGRSKIKMDPQDYLFLAEFINDVLTLQYADEIMFAINALRADKAFSHVLCSDDYGIEGFRRIALTNQKSETVEKSFEMRDVQDWLAYGTHHYKVDRALMTYNYNKNVFAEQMKQSILTQRKGSRFSPYLETTRTNDLRNIIDSNDTLFGMFTKTECLDGVRKSVGIINEVSNEPVLTLEQLTATDSIDRRILAETRRRIQRQRKKIMAEPGKEASNPYVREGGIYGRKKEVDEEKECRERRERGMCSGNLWTYINEFTFDKPLGHLPDGSKSNPLNDTVEKENESEALEVGPFDAAPSQQNSPAAKCPLKSPVASSSPKEGTSTPAASLKPGLKKSTKGRGKSSPVGGSQNSPGTGSQQKSNVDVADTISPNPTAPKGGSGKNTSVRFRDGPLESNDAESSPNSTRVEGTGNSSAPADSDQVPILPELNDVASPVKSHNGRATRSRQKSNVGSDSIPPKSTAPKGRIGKNTSVRFRHSSQDSKDAASPPKWSAPKGSIGKTTSIRLRGGPAESNDATNSTSPPNSTPPVEGTGNFSAPPDQGPILPEPELNDFDMASPVKSYISTVSGRSDLTDTSELPDI